MIDREQSRDLDDALWVTPDPDGGWIATVHIAAVAPLVPLGGDLDRAARRQVESRYHARHTVPMLGSLEGEATLTGGAERLALTITTTFDEHGERTHIDVHPSVLAAGSCVRIPHSKVAAALADPQHPLSSTLQCAHQLSQLLLARRQAAGALAIYDLPRGYAVSEDGALSIIAPSVRAAYLIVTELMTASCAALADWCIDVDLEVLYRNHRTNLLGTNGEDLATDIAATLHDPELFTQLTDRVRRTFGRATYSTRPRGHHGLRVPAHTHITSPLRRYADLVTQRIVWAHLSGRPSPYTHDELEAIAQELNSYINTKKASATDHFRRQQHRQSARHILDRNYAALSQQQWRKMFDLMTKTGPAPGIEAELLRRLDGEILVPNDLARLATTSPAWEPIRKRIFAKVRAIHPEFAAGVVSGRAQILGIDHTVGFEVAEHPSRPSHQPLFAVRASHGAAIGRWQTAESKKAATAQAVWELIEVVCGHSAGPPNEPAPWPDTPLPAHNHSPDAVAPIRPALPNAQNGDAITLPESARAKLAALVDQKRANALGNPVGWLAGFGASQALGEVRYEQTAAGKSHAQTFTCAATLVGVTCTESASSKSTAKVAAATALLNRFLAVPE